MKLSRRTLKLSIVAAGWICFILLCCSSFQEGKEKMMERINTSLDKAISIDYEERYNKVLVMYCPAGRELKGFRIKGKNGIETITFADSTKEHAGAKLANQYILATLNPIKPDDFNSLFKKILNEKGISPLKTGIIYCNNREKQYSGNDSVSSLSAATTPIQIIDAKKTISIQAWATYSWITIIKHIAPGLLGCIIVYLIILIAISFLFLVKRLERMPLINNECIQLGKMTLNLESHNLYIEGHKCTINKADFELLVLFIKAPSYTLPKEDTSNAFWPKDNKPENKIYSHISTLRSSLREVPGYEIEMTKKGKYRLIVP